MLKVFFDVQTYYAFNLTMLLKIQIKKVKFTLKKDISCHLPDLILFSGFFNRINNREVLSTLRLFHPMARDCHRVRLPAAKHLAYSQVLT